MPGDSFILTVRLDTRRLGARSLQPSLTMWRWPVGVVFPRTSDSRLPDCTQSYPLSSRASSIIIRIQTRQFSQCAFRSFGLLMESLPSPVCERKYHPSPQFTPKHHRGEIFAPAYLSTLHSPTNILSRHALETRLNEPKTSVILRLIVRW